MHLAGTWDASSWGYYTLNRPPLCETIKHSRAAQHHHQVCMYVRGMNMHNAAAYTDHSNQYTITEYSVAVYIHGVALGILGRRYMSHELTE